MLGVSTGFVRGKDLEGSIHLVTVTLVPWDPGPAWWGQELGSSEEPSGLAGSLSGGSSFSAGACQCCGRGLAGLRRTPFPFQAFSSPCFHTEGSCGDSVSAFLCEHALGHHPSSWESGISESPRVPAFWAETNGQSRKMLFISQQVLVPIACLLKLHFSPSPARI